MIFTFASAEELAERKESQEREIEVIREKLQLLEKDIDGFETAGYAHFKSQVLPLWRDRIANLRMRVDPKDTDENLKLIGRYEMILELMTKPDELVEKTKQLRRQQISLLEELKHTQEEIERDKKRRAV